MGVHIFILILGLVLVVKGADWLVAGASSLAKQYNVSDLAIGLTIVAFGTSAPELVVNVFAASQGTHDIVFGNVIGSNNFNLFIILGIAGVITPMVVQSTTAWREIPISLIAVLMVFLLANPVLFTDKAMVSRLDGIILLALFLLFLFYVYKQLKRDEASAEVAVKAWPAWKIWTYIIIGLAGLVLGGRLVVNHAVLIASALGVSDKIVGLTIVAAGTSLPELATSLVAAVRKNNDIAVGNIIGSNIFNIFLVLGLSAVVSPLHFSEGFNTDLYILGGGTLFLLLAMFTGERIKIDRWEAALLLVFYVGYTVFLLQGAL